MSVGRVSSWEYPGEKPCTVMPAQWQSNSRRVTFRWAVNSFWGIFQETSFVFTSVSRERTPLSTNDNVPIAATHLLTEPT